MNLLFVNSIWLCASLVDLDCMATKTKSHLVAR